MTTHPISDATRSAIRSAILRTKLNPTDGRPALDHAVDLARKEINQVHRSAEEREIEDAAARIRRAGGKPLAIQGHNVRCRMRGFTCREIGSAFCECGEGAVICNCCGGTKAARDWLARHRASCKKHAALWELEYKLPPGHPADESQEPERTTLIESDWPSPWQGPCWCGAQDRLFVGAVRVRFGVNSCNDSCYPETWVFTRCSARHVLHTPFWLADGQYWVDVDAAVGFERDEPKITTDANRIAAADAALLIDDVFLAACMLTGEDLPSVQVPNRDALVSLVMRCGDNLDGEAGS